MTDASLVALRRPTEDDQPWIRDRVDDWFGRKVRHLVRRVWFRHFTDTSRVAVLPNGRVVGFLLGFVSPGLPGTAVLHLVAVDPRHQRQGIGRLLVDSFVADAREAGRVTIEAEHWPDEPRALGFLRALGFVPDPLVETRPLYGVPALPEHEGANEDRVRFVRTL